MPTHPQAFVVVANALNGAPLQDTADAATGFFEWALPKWREDARAVIFDFLLACAEPPTADELNALVDLVGTAASPKRLPAEIVDLGRAREQRAAPKRSVSMKKPIGARRAATQAPAPMHVAEVTRAKATKKAGGKAAAKRVIKPTASAPRSSATTAHPTATKRPSTPAPRSRSR